VPAGIPWLPQIPEGWEVKKVRQIAKEGKCKNKGNVEKNVLSLSYGKIIRKKEIYSGLVPTDFATYQIVEKGNVVLRLTDLQNDHRSLRCGLVCERGIITSAYVSLVPGKILPEYLYLILHSCDLHKVFYSLGGGLRQSMNYADVGNLMIPLPTIQEQQIIAEYVDRKVKQFDELTAGLTQQVAALKEYKQRLIADVVTGQMRVA
ncbi:MAG: restriction endonuclease subunit S, partial [bacterium]|nr:restriction endonuclease subunit S [bacterium]